VVMNGGRIEQIGAPLELYHRPMSLFVARFIGSPTMNTIEAVATPGDQGGIVINTLGRDFRLPGVDAVTGKITLGIRPGDLKACAPEHAWFEGEISVAERLGSQTFAYVEIADGQMFSVEFDRNADVSVGERIYLSGDSAAVHLFDNETGRRIN
jgi:multiple sugar transport system ATP-binding protein